MSQDELFEWEDTTLDPIQKQPLDWSGEPIPPPVKHDNPCINLYGEGPQDKTCGDCEHLFRDNHHGTTYPKCELRKLTRGPGSDHRVRWPTCGRFEQRIAQDGDILVEKSHGGYFAAYTWKRTWWQYLELWTIMNIVDLCEEKEHILIKHIPEDSTYEGIYRKRNTTAREDGSDEGGTCESHEGV